MDPADFELVHVDVDVIALDDLDLSPSIVKIDVEGFELSVLRGLERTIARCRPLLLLETPPDVFAVAEHLAGWGYQPYRWNDRARVMEPHRPPSTNVFFLTANGMRAQ